MGRPRLYNSIFSPKCGVYRLIVTRSVMLAGLRPQMPTICPGVRRDIKKLIVWTGVCVFVRGQPYYTYKRREYFDKAFGNTGRYVSVYYVPHLSMCVVYHFLW